MTPAREFWVEVAATRLHPDPALELRHLRYYCAVAETLNFSRAAERMHVAQPALSRQIKSLEEEIGVKLLQRSTTQVRLTDAGRHFYENSKKLLAQLAADIAATQEIEHGGRGDLQIASDWRIPMHLIPETVRVFRQHNPKCSVNFIDMPVTQQMEKLRAGELHLCCVPDMVLGDRTDLELHSLYKGDILAVLPSSHHFARRKNLKLRELSEETWIVPDHDPKLDARIFLNQACRIAGFTPKYGRAAASIPATYSLVSAGEGIALMPRVLLPEEFRGISTILTDCEPINLYAVWLKSTQSPLLRRFLEILCQQESAPASKRASKKR